MDFLEKLNLLMRRDNYNKNSLSKASGIPYTTIDNWYKRGYDNLQLPTVKKLCSFFDTSLDFWLKDEINDPNYGKACGFEVSFSEMECIKKYRSLDPYGQETVNYILNRETERVRQLRDVQKNPPAALRIYTYMRKIACAGKGFYFDDIPTDTIEAPYRENADFIIGVSGDSMEPTYSDGDLVYVEKCQIVKTGEIGIFILNGECFIKEAGEHGLKSHNSEYGEIPGSENVICVGRVLGKVENSPDAMWK